MWYAKNEIPGWFTNFIKEICVFFKYAINPKIQNMLQSVEVLCFLLYFLKKPRKKGCLKKRVRLVWSIMWLSLINK